MTREWLSEWWPYLTLPVLSGVVIWLALRTAGRRMGARPTPESAETATLLFRWNWLQSGWAALAVTVVFLITVATLRSPSLDPRVIKVLPFAPAVPLAWFLIAFRAEVRGGDEFVRRLHQEALTFAFPSVLLFAVLMWTMDRVMGPPYSHLQIAPFLGLNYWAGLWFARMRFVPYTTSKDSQA